MKYYEILKDFDPNTNAREIIKNVIEKFKKSPSMYWANRLGEYGIEVDFDNYDSVFVGESDFNHVIQ
jgi:hypothetical protein